MFQPRGDQQSAVTDNGKALHRPLAPSVYHRLLCHAVFTMLLAALAVVQACYLMP